MPDSLPHFDRTDRLLWLGGVLALALFLGSMLLQTGGHLALPLDDSYIYFQYARQTARGHVLQYNTGDPPTTGATSLLYLALLVPAQWLGFRGTGTLVFALGVGLACLCASLWLIRRIGATLGDGAAGTPSALLLLLCGPLLWGYFSGMEIGLFATLLLATTLSLAREEGESRFRRTVWWAVALAAARPEGGVLACLVVLAMVYRTKRAQGGRQLAFLLLPAGVFLGQAALVAWMTGEGGSAGLASKWRLSAPHVSFPDALRLTLFDALDTVKGVLGGSLGAQSSANLYAYDGNPRRMFFGPFFLLFAVLGLAPGAVAELRRGKPATHTLGGVLLVVGVLITSTIEEPDAHFSRYQQPFLPLFVLFGAIGLCKVGRVLGEVWRHVGTGLLGAYALFGATTAVFFGLAYGDNCADIHRMQVTLGKFLDERLPRNARVAVNDAGALKYYGNRHIVDLVGLVTPGFSKGWRHGSGSLYERLESMPEGRRPTYFAIFPNWFQFGEAGILERVHAVRLFTPSIVDAEKVLYRADWALANTGDAVTEASVLEALEGWRVSDRVDVADLDSEAEHGYVSTVWEPGQKEANLLMRHAYGEQEGEVVDGGRTVTRGERMRVRVARGRPVRVVMRTLDGVRQHFSVLCNGQPVGEVRQSGGRARAWTDVAIAEIPAGRVTADEIEVETRAVHTGGAASGIVSFHYWFYQPEEGSRTQNTGDRRRGR